MNAQPSGPIKNEDSDAAANPHVPPPNAHGPPPEISKWHISDRPIFFVTLAGVIAVVAYTTVAAWQACLTRDQLAVLQRQLSDQEIQESASITISNLVVAGFPDNPVMKFDVKNSGRTRADEVTVVGDYLWTGRGGEMEILGKPETYFKMGTTSKLGFSLEPTDPPRQLSMPMTKIPPTFPSMTQAEKAKFPTRNDFIIGKFVSIYAVIVNYKDVFGRITGVSNCILYNENGWSPCFGQNGHYPIENKH